MKRLFFFFIFIPVFLSAQNSNLQWVHSLGRTSNDGGLSIVSDEFGNTYTLGFFHDSIDVDPDPNTKHILKSMGDIDLFVLKLDANGDFVWATRFGGTDEDYGDELVLIDDKIFVSGRFELSFNVKVNFTSQTYQSKGYKDVFLMCMNTSGNVLWNRTFGGPASDYARGLTADSLKNVYLTGSYR
ncbi:MAG: SBBP repeat-containing protein, partial [Schleiferiaceae bacterium]|nr:SBBP repeat-containing protein [Schleiferiaceae bacterium]